MLNCYTLFTLRTTRIIMDVRVDGR